MLSGTRNLRTFLLLSDDSWKKHLCSYFWKKYFLLLSFTLKDIFLFYYWEQLQSYKCTAGHTRQIFNYTSPSVSSLGANCSRLIRIKTYSMTLKNCINASLPKSPVLFGAIQAQQLLFASEKGKLYTFTQSCPSLALLNPTVQKFSASILMVCSTLM